MIHLPSRPPRAGASGSSSPGLARRHAGLVIAATAAVLYALIHFHAMQRFLDHDQVVYIRNIRSQLVKHVIFNPHHLHFEWSGLQFDRLVRGGLGERAPRDLVFHLRLRSLVFACLGAFFAALLLHRLTGRALFSGLGAFVILGSHGYLSYATKIDTGVFPAAWIFVVLWQLHRIQSMDRVRLRSGLLFGLNLFAGVLLHQLMGLAAIAAGLALLAPRGWFSGEARMRGRRAALALATLVCAGAGGATYFYLGHVYYNLPLDEPRPWQVRGVIWNGHTLQTWPFAYVARDAPYGKSLTRFDPKQLARGLSDAALARTNPRRKHRHSTRFEFDFAGGGATGRPFRVFAFTIAGVLLLAVLLGPDLLRGYGRALLALALSFIGFTFAALAIEPHYYEFWILPWSLFVLLGLLCVDRACTRLAELRLSPLADLARLSAPGLLVLTLWSHNTRYHLQPHSRYVYTEGLYYHSVGELEGYTSERLYRTRVPRRMLAGNPRPDQPEDGDGVGKTGGVGARGRANGDIKD